MEVGDCMSNCFFKSRFAILALFFIFPFSSSADVYVVGDSLAYGTGAKDSKNTPTGCLAAKYTSLTATNLATPGHTSQQVLDQIPQFLNPAPQLVFISTGGNDALTDYYKPGTYPAQKSLAELRTIIEQFQKAGAVVAFLKISPPFDPNSAKRLENMAIQAELMGAIIVDGMAGLWNTDKMSDDFHPNDEGYKLMCKKITEAIAPYFP